MECEFALWKVQWTERKELASEISTAAAALEHCSPVTLPNIRALLVILATLPVTTAEAERNLSKVERTATAARAHMTEDRLEALVMLSAHRQNPQHRGGR